MELKEAAGYFLPLRNSIVNMRKQLRGDSEGDAYVIAHYSTTGTCTVLSKGYLRAENQTVNNLDVISSNNMLQELLDRENSDARFKYCCQHADRRKVEEGTMAALFVKCKNDGVIGAAWLDNNGSSRKALLMCGFLCYELGMINAERDKDLWKSTHEYLTDDNKLIQDVKVVERIIRLAFREEAARQQEGKIIIVPRAE